MGDVISNEVAGTAQGAPPRDDREMAHAERVVRRRDSR
jgi:hypothetical protein